MTDPYQYFRIEARELIDEITVGLTGLRRAGPGDATAGLVGGLLRHAHTLKGAARVVDQPGIADHTHNLETLLEPYRGQGDPIGETELQAMFAIIDGIASELALIPSGADEAPVIPAQATAPALETTPAAAGLSSSPNVIGTARASLIEIDSLIDGIAEARSQLGTLRAATGRMTGMRERFGDRPGPTEDDRARKVAGLEDLAQEIERSLNFSLERVERELREVQDIAERLRLVPIATIVPDLDRAVRDVATTQSKRAFLDVTGDGLRLDVPVLTLAHDALRQIVRNAVAHGIETPDDRMAVGKAPEGLIRLDISRRGPDVVFSVSDDGRGVDVGAVRGKLAETHPEAAGFDDDQVLRTLMLGGVSTAEVLSEVSGRGIGLDLVRDCARRLGGTVEIRTEPGRGTTIDLITPLSLTAQDVLVVDAGDLYGFPLSAVARSSRIGSDDITRGLRGESVVTQGEAVPFLPLTALLGDDQTTGVSQPNWSVVLVEGRAGKAAIGVRRLVNGASVAIRALPPSAGVSPLVSGVWIDVDGAPRLMLDPEHVITAALRQRQLTAANTVHHAPILVVDDSLTTRMLEQSILEAAGYTVETASSAEEGLEKAASRPYSLALVDVEMPGMNGFQFIEQTRARAELRHLPCILVTTRASTADRQRGVDAGARAHIDKGEFHQGTLLTHVAELLAR